MERNDFTAVLRRTVAIPMIALAILATVLLWETQSLHSSMQWVDHTDQVISAGEQLIKLVIDMETGVRGYLETGKSEFLQPYNEANLSISSKFDALRQLVSDNPTQQARLALISSRVDQWRLDAERVIASRRNGEESPYDPDLDKQLMDSLRAEHDVFIATEEGLRTQRVRTASNVSRLLTVTCVLLSLCIASFLAIFTRRQIRSLGANFQTSLAIAENSATPCVEVKSVFNCRCDRRTSACGTGT